MGVTPEGKVKKVVTELLKNTPSCYYHMPVPGYGGDTTLDYVGSHMGRFFAIETKATGKKMTDRQKMIATVIARSGAKVFLIDGPESDGMKALKMWLGDEQPGSGVTP